MEATMIESNEQGFEQFFPSREDIAAIFEDDDAWQQCDFCGEDYPVGAECGCNDGYPRDSEGDFPLYMEYEGVTGLAGYDDFYDSGNEW